MAILTRRSVLRGSLALAATGALARPYVANAAATTANVMSNIDLVRMGVLADLADQTAFIMLALVLFALLRQIHQGMARAMLVFVAIAVTDACFQQGGVDFEKRPP